MTLETVAPYLTGPALAAFAVMFSHFLSGLAKHAVEKAAETEDPADDIVAAKWAARAMWLSTAVDFTVRWFVPQAFAPKRGRR
jgi:hypothetical protein